MVLQGEEIHEDSIAICIQARLSSTRFPKKALARIDGQSILSHCLERAYELIRLIPQSEAFLCVPHTELEEFQYGVGRGFVTIVGGSPTSLIDRFQNVVGKFKPAYIMRITADCPFWSPALALKLYRKMWYERADFAYIQTPNDYPDGLDVEIIRRDLWESLSQDEHGPEIEEHVTIGLKTGVGPQPLKTVVLPKSDLYDVGFKLSVDTPEDLKMIEARRDDIWWIPARKNFGTD